MMKNLRDELRERRIDLDLIGPKYCTPEESAELKRMRKAKEPLPDGIEIDQYDDFFRWESTGLSTEEIAELLEYRRTAYLRTIKNCAVFFVSVFVVSLILAFILGAMA